MSVEIYICDLKPEVQEQVLSELNLSSDKDGNYDLFPLFVVEKPEPVKHSEIWRITMDKEREIKIDKVTYTVERHFSPRIPLKELLVKQIASVKKKEDAKRTSDTDEIA